MLLLCFSAKGDYILILSLLGQLELFPLLLVFLATSFLPRLVIRLGQQLLQLVLLRRLDLIESAEYLLSESLAFLSVHE
jgi:hypothetical protein